VSGARASVIIGYDDTCGPNGAVLVQNSFGSSWGSQWNGHGGYVWIDNDTFQAMIQGGGVHITG
jgi:C1A family cysteine protease